MSNIENFKELYDFEFEEIKADSFEEIEKKYAPGPERLFKGDGTQLKLGGVLGIDYEETKDGYRIIAPAYILKKYPKVAMW